MKKIGAVVEGLILQAIAVYVGILVLAGDYWRFLNPKFKWLTGATAVVLLVTGTVAIFNPHRRPNLARIVAFLFFLRILTMGMSGSISYIKGFSAGLDGIDQPVEKPRLIMNDREYIRINLGELYQLGERPASERTTMAYVVKGRAMKSQALDEAGQFVLMRVAVFCCLADALGMGIRVNYDSLNGIADGQWVEVFGSMKRLPHKLPQPGLHTPGLFLSVISDTYILVPDKIIPIQEPHIPFMFEFRKAEPYAY
jgi:hypothetical protein